MFTLEIIDKNFKELKSCPPAEVSKHALAILEAFTYMERAELAEIGEEIYNWAKQNTKKKPLLFAYAKLIQTFSILLNENYDPVLPLITEIQNLFLEQNDLKGAAICNTLVGNIYRTFGNYDLALKSLWAAHDELKQSELHQHVFLACSNAMGGIYLDMKYYDEATEIFKNSLELAEKSGRYYWIIYALHGLGKIYLVKQQFPEAKESFEKAMVVADKNKLPVAICNSLSELGNYFYTVSDYGEAEKLHLRALTIREQNKFIGGAITSCLRLGEIYIKESKPEEAIAILNKGLTLAEPIGVKLKMYQIHFLLSKIYESKNDLEKSLKHYKIYHELRDQVEVEDSTRKIKNAQLVFEAEQTKKENIIIKKQKQEIEKKNIELQETIDELTRAKIGRKARAITLIIAIALFIMEDTILHFALIIVPEDNYFVSLIVKMVIIFSLSPINKAIEKYLLSKVVKKKKTEVLVLSGEAV